MSPARKNTLHIDLYDQPGHLIRRAHQIAVSKFHERVGRNVTPVQYAILRMLQDRPGIDQVTLAQLVLLDNSTTADIAARLETKGLISRELRARGQRSLELTPAGEDLLARLVAGVRSLQSDLLGRLEPAERLEFLRLLRKFSDLGAASRAASG
ncbi:MAG: MarR family transcriptional regulator [Burkholderiales bacterium]|nr:MarR family transcriptional regulator [Burkholderiales bacterium]MDE1928927.1 MarR family transcriptional regulator [Burkholderiales bacterium]MDE2158604.1 MarR family transcriptional regulator [Burkholderiales bacterium]MDE2504739.1 MarR family transcriptional regulator [Burkholderiales bacterium]